MKTIAVACLLLLAVFDYGEPAMARTVLEIANQYRSAKTPYDRVLLCVEAINEGHIAPGREVSVVKQIFGDAVIPPRLGTPEKGALETAVVFFNIEDIKANTKPNSTAALSGWYFYCYFDETKKITKYFLTNAPFKETF